MGVETERKYKEPLTNQDGDTTSVRIKFNFTKEEALDYLRHSLQDGDITSVHIKFRFDEQQADVFHHFWSGETFIEAIKKLIE